MSVGTAATAAATRIRKKRWCKVLADGGDEGEEEGLRVHAISVPVVLDARPKKHCTGWKSCFYC